MELRGLTDACVRTRRYNLHLFEREGAIKEALGTMLEKYPDVRAVLLGARNTDPYYGGYGGRGYSDRYYGGYGGRGYSVRYYGGYGGSRRSEGRGESLEGGTVVGKPVRSILRAWCCGRYHNVIHMWIQV